MAILRHLHAELPDLAPLLVTSSPYAHLPIRAGIPTLRLPGALESRRFAFDPPLPAADLLVVDTFADGAHGELTAERLQAFPRRALIAREHAPEGRAWPVYHLRLAPHDEDPRPGVEAVGPVLLRQPEEALAPQQARLALGMGPGPLVVAMHAGDDGEIMGFFDQVTAAVGLLPGVQLVLLTPLPLPGGPWPDVRHVHPAMEVLPAADLILCGAGYNSYWETRALGKRVLLRPFGRSHDKQEARAGDGAAFTALTGPDELAARIQAALGAEAPAAVRCDGARLAASRLATLVKRPPAC
ncbi:MAG: hypothetical protein JWM80_2606 [Cyanobacteria bacterium RYN_339]|nr:hypothetical protein [Cyanobacteria bacterium RYN_339]